MREKEGVATISHAKSDARELSEVIATRRRRIGCATSAVASLGDGTSHPRRQRWRGGIRHRARSAVLTLAKQQEQRRRGPRRAGVHRAAQTQVPRRTTTLRCGRKTATSGGGIANAGDDGNALTWRRRSYRMLFLAELSAIPHTKMTARLITRNRPGTAGLPSDHIYSAYIFSGLVSYRF